jgi:RNA polymerase sigma factor (TIGR02999 family)
LAGRDSIPWQDRAHFFAVAAQMMRQILVDHARKRSAAKRGAGVTINLSLDEISVPSQQPNLDVLALDDALTRLASFDPRQSQIVELRFFGGLSIEKTAEIVKISPATAKREWTTARLWLHQTMSEAARS